MFLTCDSSFCRETSVSVARAFRDRALVRDVTRPSAPTSKSPNSASRAQSSSQTQLMSIALGSFGWPRESSSITIVPLELVGTYVGGQRAQGLSLPVRLEP